MAGFVLTLGENNREAFSQIRGAFTDFKDLPESHEHLHKNFHLAKYKRRIDIEDTNYFESENIIVCAVGSLLYRDFGFFDSVKEIGKTLDQGNNIRKMVDDIDGTFCLTVLDKRIGKCFVVTDIGGVINTYLRKVDNAFFISTSMLALAKVATVTLDSASVLMFIRCGIFFDDTTYFNEINVLRPASIYEYDAAGGCLRQSTYWEIPKAVNRSISFEEAADKITRSLYHILDAVPNDKAIYDFTGGYDSRFVLSLVYGRAKEKKTINTFFFGPLESREAKIVRNNCENLGIKHYNYEPPRNWPGIFFEYVVAAHKLSDGMEDACAYAQVLLNQKLKRKTFQFSVHGPFGELFRQRRWITEFGKRGKNVRPNLARLIKYRDLTDDHDESIYSKEWTGFMRDVPKRLEKIYKRTLELFDGRAPNTLQLDYIYFYQKARRWGGRTITTANQIIQPICPLWFRRPLEISFALPPEYKKMSKLMRYIVEKESPGFAKERMITGAPFLQINLKNLYRFLPALSFFSRIGIRKFCQVFLHKSIWTGLTVPDYNVGEWYRGALKDPACQELLDYEGMGSKAFYERGGFLGFVQRAKSRGFHFYGQLGRIITVELTLRALGRNTDESQ
jgi:asparagine synthetase B (glutamine-hydrolysing)